MQLQEALLHSIKKMKEKGQTYTSLNTDKELNIVLRLTQ